jgi:hypothetical protein
MNRQLIGIILITIFVSSAAGSGITGFVLDRSWNNYVNHMAADYENKIIEVERKAENLMVESDARGYWRAMYSMCYIMLYGNSIKCARGARQGYKEGNHLQPAPPGWDWFFIKYQGQVQ